MNSRTSYSVKTGRGRIVATVLTLGAMTAMIMFAGAGTLPGEAIAFAGGKGGDRGGSGSGGGGNAGGGSGGGNRNPGNAGGNRGGNSAGRGSSGGSAARSAPAPRQKGSPSAGSSRAPSAPSKVNPAPRGGRESSSPRVAPPMPRIAPPAPSQKNPTPTVKGPAPISKDRSGSGSAGAPTFNSGNKGDGNSKPSRPSGVSRPEPRPAPKPDSSPLVRPQPKGDPTVEFASPGGGGISKPSKQDRNVFPDRGGKNVVTPPARTPDRKPRGMHDPTISGSSDLDKGSDTVRPMPSKPTGSKSDSIKPPDRGFSNSNLVGGGGKNGSGAIKNPVTISKNQLQSKPRHGGGGGGNGKSQSNFAKSNYSYKDPTVVYAGGWKGGGGYHGKRWDNDCHNNSSWNGCGPYSSGFYFGYGSWCNDFSLSISIGSYRPWYNCYQPAYSCYDVYNSCGSFSAGYSSWGFSYRWFGGCWDDCNWYRPVYRSYGCYRPRYACYAPVYVQPYPVYTYTWLEPTPVYTTYYTMADVTADDAAAEVAYSPDVFTPAPAAASTPVFESGGAVASTASGWQLLANGDAREARRSFDRSMTVQPADALPRIGYAIAAGLLERDEEAIANMRQALRDDAASLNEIPQNSGMSEQIHTLRLRFELRLKKESAGNDLLFMVAALRHLDGDDALAYFAADQAIEQGDTDAATRNLKRLIRAALDKAELATEPAAPAAETQPGALPEPPSSPLEDSVSY